MSSWYSTRHRGEMLLAYLRLGLAFLTLFAFRFDVALGNSHVASAVYGYGAIASFALVFIARTFPTLRLRLWLQAFDLLFSLFFIFVGASSVTLVVAHYAFILSTGAVRFRAATIFWNACLAVAVYLNALLIEGSQPPAHAAGNLLVFAFLGAVAIAVVSYQNRLRRQISAVLDVHAGSVDSLHGLLADGLAQLSVAVSVPRIFFALEIRDQEPRAGCWMDGRLHLDEESSAWFDLIDESLEHDDFFINDLRRGIVTTSSGERRKLREPIAVDVAAAHQIDSLLRVKLQSDAGSGSLFFVDRAFDVDDLSLGRLSADTFASRLDDFHVAGHSAKKMVAIERSRIARDLHDGLLQSLTGAALQLETARRLIDAEPAEAKELLGEVQDVLTVDQHELRYLIDALRQSTRKSAGDLNSEIRYNALAAIVKRQWNATVDLRLPSLKTALSRTDRREVHRLLREAIFNAAKHSGGRTIVADGEVDGSWVRLTVRDDGKGFSFRGRYDLPSLIRMSEGPATLKERVEALGGTLVIDSHENGSIVEMRIPVREAGVSA